MEKKSVAWPYRETSTSLGLDEKSVKQYSIFNAIKALAFRGTVQQTEFEIEAGFELECSRELAKLGNRQYRGLAVPAEVLSYAQRGLSVGSDPGGGYLVQTTLLSESFIERLRNRLVVKQAGATVLSGLVGDVGIPKQTGTATAYWLAENGAPTESQQTFGQLALAPKTIGAHTVLSRRFLLQSSLAGEPLVRNDLSRVLASGIDLACLHGTGVAPQPAGIAVTAGIGSVVGGTNGGAPTWVDIVNLETQVSQDNGDTGSVAYITNSKVRGKLLQTHVNATYGERPLWATKGPGVGELNGYPAYVSNQVSSTLTKGSSNECSAIFFGNFSDLILAFWSGLDVLVDAYTNSTTGAVRVTAFQDLDIGIRHPESFSVMLDALTV